MFKWDVDPSLAFPEFVEQYTRITFRTGRIVGEQRAAEAEMWMKENAPWQDVTGAAREGLHAEFRQEPRLFGEITLAHGDHIPYGIWLEVAHGGRWGIISRAVDFWGRRFMNDVQRIMRLHSGRI